jgi:hypothetical protein
MLALILFGLWVGKMGIGDCISSHSRGPTHYILKFSEYPVFPVCCSAAFLKDRLFDQSDAASVHYALVTADVHDC